MDFSEKLTFLLNITNTTGAQLAHSLDVKSSIISLYRTGKRGAPKKESTIKRFADFFASKINDEYQRQALFEIMELPPISQPFSVEELSDTLLMWLSNKKYISLDPGHKLLNALERSDDISDINLSLPSEMSPVNFAKGTSGKREILRNFLSYILTVENPSVLYLQYDENIEWLLNDAFLTSEMMNTIKIMAQRGCKIVQFLPPPTNDNLIKIYTDWMPIYFTVDVDVYYYPRFRDNSFRNFIWVLEGEAAVFSMGIYNGASPSFAGFIKNPQAIEILVGMLKDYKNICRNAFAVLKTQPEIDSIRQQMGQLPIPRISSRSMLPHELLPKELLDSANDHFALYKDTIYRVPDDFDFDVFFSQEHIDICNTYSAEQILNDDCYITIPDFIGVHGPKYTPTTYKQHLMSILKAMQEHESYTFIPVPQDSNPVTLIIRRGTRAILMHKSIHPHVLLVTEPDLIRSLEEHINQKIDKLNYGKDIRKYSMIFLKNLIKELEEYEQH